MAIFEIEILNPKAKKLLEDLASLKLIKITSKTDKNKEFKKLLKKLRQKSEETISLEEITKDVEVVRSKRYNE